MNIKHKPSVMETQKSEQTIAANQNIENAVFEELVAYNRSRYSPLTRPFLQLPEKKLYRDILKWSVNSFSLTNVWCLAGTLWRLSELFCCLLKFAFSKFVIFVLNESFRCSMILVSSFILP